MLLSDSPQALGAVDYLEISQQFDVVLLRNIQAMDLTKRTEARRFITLIDTLYDAKVKLVISSRLCVLLLLNKFRLDRTDTLSLDGVI